MIKELIKKFLNDGLVSKEEKIEIFSYLRHIPNFHKTEEEWELYKKICKEKRLPEPNRYSKIRPLHESNNKYND